MEDSNSLDLTDTTETGVRAPFVFTRDHADWLTTDGQACFARGTGDSVAQSQTEANAALTLKDTLSSPFGLDSARPTLGLTDVRAQPSKKDEGYAALETEGELSDTTAIIQTLISHRDLIMNNHMIYQIVDNRTPAAVPYWPAFAAWWASRRCLVGPQDERTEILWICADATTDNAFRDCKLLNSVLAPGCREFGYKVFSECCSLQCVYASGGAVNVFSGDTNFGQYLFQGCINPAEVTVSEVPSPRSELNGLTQQDRTRELAPGCLSSTGIYTLVLPKHFVAIGAHACDSCRLLNSVDLRNTMIEEIPEFTFAHCTSLREVFLPTTLHTIRVKAFMNCAALVELAIPPALKYIGSRAFLDCTALRRLIKLPGARRWHGVYAEENAFAICPDIKWPLWLHMIPDMGYTPGLGWKILHPQLSWPRYQFC